MKPVLKIYALKITTNTIQLKIIRVFNQFSTWDLHAHQCPPPLPEHWPRMSLFRHFGAPHTGVVSHTSPQFFIVLSIRGRTGKSGHGHGRHCICHLLKVSYSFIFTDDQPREGIFFVCLVCPRWKKNPLRITSFKHTSQISLVQFRQILLVYTES